MDTRHSPPSPHSSQFSQSYRTAPAQSAYTISYKEYPLSIREDENVVSLILNTWGGSTNVTGSLCFLFGFTEIIHLVDHVAMRLLCHLSSIYWKYLPTYNCLIRNVCYNKRKRCVVSYITAYNLQIYSVNIL